jgi:hypothetical protein
MQVVLLGSFFDMGKRETTKKPLDFQGRGHLVSFSQELLCH